MSADPRQQISFRRLTGRARNIRFLRQRFDPAEQILFARHSRYLIAELAILEEQQRGDGADIVLERETLILIYVYFSDLHGIGFFAGDFVEEWRDQFARPAPLSPEVYQHRFVAVDFAVKVRFVQIDCPRVFHGFKKDNSKSEESKWRRRPRAIPSIRA